MVVAITHCETGHAAHLTITADTGVTFNIRVTDDFDPDGATITVERVGRLLFEHTEPNNPNT